MSFSSVVPPPSARSKINLAANGRHDGHVARFKRRMHGLQVKGEIEKGRDPGVVVEFAAVHVASRPQQNWQVAQITQPIVETCNPHAVSGTTGEKSKSPKKYPAVSASKTQPDLAKRRDDTMVSWKQLQTLNRGFF